MHEAARPAREVATNTRSASLRPRRLNDHVRVIWRLVPVTITVASLATFAWRLSVPGPDRRLLLPAAFALAAPVFIWLYEVWMREEVSGGSADGDPSREASRLTKVRLIFAAELTLVLWLTLSGHALLDLDWAAPRPWAGVVVVTSAVLGIAGCALAVSSDLARRRYAPHDPRSSFPRSFRHAVRLRQRGRVRLRSAQIPMQPVHDRVVPEARVAGLQDPVPLVRKHQELGGHVLRPGAR